MLYIMRNQTVEMCKIPLKDFVGLIHLDDALHVQAFDVILIENFRRNHAEDPLAAFRVACMLKIRSLMRQALSKFDKLYPIRADEYGRSRITGLDVAVGLRGQIGPDTALSLLQAIDKVTSDKEVFTWVDIANAFVPLSLWNDPNGQRPHIEMVDGSDPALRDM